MKTKTEEVAIATRDCGGGCMGKAEVCVAVG